MNSFNKTAAAVFSCRLCFLRAFPFISLIPNVASRQTYMYNFRQEWFHSNNALFNIHWLSQFIEKSYHKQNKIWMWYVQFKKNVNYIYIVDEFIEKTIIIQLFKLYFEDLVYTKYFTCFCLNLFSTFNAHLFLRFTDLNIWRVMNNSCYEFHWAALVNCVWSNVPIIPSALALYCPVFVLYVMMEWLLILSVIGQFHWETGKS